jgi:hypothetical protein
MREAARASALHPTLGVVEVGGGVRADGTNLSLPT